MVETPPSRPPLLGGFEGDFGALVVAGEGSWSWSWSKREVEMVEVGDGDAEARNLEEVSLVSVVFVLPHVN